MSEINDTKSEENKETQNLTNQNTQNSENIFGKKVLFLNPHSVIQKDLIEEIIKYEYEVYIVNDHRKAIRIIEKYNNSILFINIDSMLKEKEWEEYVRNIMSNPVTSKVMIGILSYNENPQLIEKYVMQLMVPCGYIVLKLGLAESLEIILKVLETAEAKGRRKFVRAKCADSLNVGFNAKIRGKIFEGSINDISSAGMCCTFNDPDLNFNKELPVGLYLRDIQLKLKGIIVMVEGKIVAVRKLDKIYYVIMFENIDMIKRNKIQLFIHNFLQEKLDSEFR